MPSREDLILQQCQTIQALCVVAANEASAAADAVGRAGFAPLDSPAFMGTPTAPTPPGNDASDRLATTGFIGLKLGQPGGIATLGASGQVPVTQLPFTGIVYDGPWDAASNTPHLTSGSGVGGHFRVVSIAGTTTLDGISTWGVGDWAIFSGTTWGRIPLVAPPISNLPLSSLAGQANNTVVANTAGGTAAPSAVSIASLTGLLNVAHGDIISVGGGSVGLVPAPPPGSAGSGAFLAADMTYKVPPAPDLSTYAHLNSPAFTGTATVTTQARGNSATAIASTEFVVKQLANGSAEAVLLKPASSVAACGSSTFGAAIDHIHPNDPSRLAITDFAAAYTPTCGRLVGASPTQVKFIPWNGNQIKIAGQLYAIPIAGILGNTTGTFVNGSAGASLAATFAYHVYAFVNGTVGLALDFVTLSVGHATDTAASNVGVEIKTGDNSRTLVGMVWINSSGQFVDNVNNRGIASWHNRQRKIFVASIGNTGTTSVDQVPLSAGLIVVTWLGDELCAFGVGQINSTGAFGLFAMAVDTATNYIGGNNFAYPVGSTGSPTQFGGFANPGEGAHSVFLSVGTSGGGGAANIFNATFNGYIVG